MRSRSVRYLHSTLTSLATGSYIAAISTNWFIQWGSIVCVGPVNDCDIVQIEISFVLIYYWLETPLKPDEQNQRNIFDSQPTSNLPVLSFKSRTNNVTTRSPASSINISVPSTSHERLQNRRANSLPFLKLKLGSDERIESTTCRRKIYRKNAITSSRC